MNETDDSDIRDVVPAKAGNEAGPDDQAEPVEAAALARTDDPSSGGFDAAIHWRGLPSLPSAQPLVAGVLQGARDADEAGPDADEAAAAPADAGPGVKIDDYFDAETALPGRAPDAAAELVLGVKFSQYGSVYFFTAGQMEPKDAIPGRMVLADTEQGVALAEIVTARRLRLPLPKIRTEDGQEAEIKSIRGLAGAADIAAAADNSILAASARMFCKECIRERGLDMKLVEVEVLHDRSKIIFYFTAPTRIDFRELVKDLVRNYHTRIELRQIGVRHETQMIGALGNCGMTCCCRRYLRKFAPVTIKMAKEQNLFLNPAKLSGMCGRLLCCLAYEQENYDEFHKRSPKIGKKYKTDHGIVKIMRANLFRQSIFALDEANVETEYQLDDWEALHPTRYDQPAPSGQVGQEGEQRRERQRRGQGERGESGAAFGEARRDAPDRPEDADEIALDFDEDSLANEDDLEQNNALPFAGRPDRPEEADTEDTSIFGLPGSRYAGRDQPRNADQGRPPGSANRQNGAAEEWRRNDNHKQDNRHKPSKKGRTTGESRG